MSESLFLIKLQALPATLLKNGTLVLVFSREFFEISKNIFSYRTPPVAASDFSDNLIGIVSKFASNITEVVTQRCSVKKVFLGI